MKRSTKNRMTFSSLMILGALAYGQHAVAGCADQAPDQAVLVPQNFTEQKLDSGAYYYAPNYGSKSCKYFIADVSLNSYSNNDGKRDRRVNLGADAQYGYNGGPSQATKATCTNYVLYEYYYTKEGGAIQFAYKDYATYQGKWVEGTTGGTFNTPSACQFKAIKARSFDWGGEPPLSGAPNSTHRVVTKMTEKKKDSLGNIYYQNHPVSVWIVEAINPPN